MKNESLKEFLKEYKNGKNQTESLKEFKPKGKIKTGERLELSLLAILYYIDTGVEAEVNYSNIPTKLKTFLPLTIYGLTDFFGAYYTTENFILQTVNPWVMFARGVVGFDIFDSVIHYYSGVRNYNNGTFLKMIKSDPATETLCFLSLETTNQNGYGTILNSLSDTSYIIDSLRIEVTTLETLNTPLIFSKVDIDGKILSDTLDLKTFITPDTFNTKIANIPLGILLDKNLIINHNLPYNSQKVTYTFSLTKIK